MASEDQNDDKLGPPDLTMASFQWGTVLAAVKDHIPSMDSDISKSDSDEDGELFIFQRDLSNLIPDLTEELEDFSLDETPLQNPFAVMRQPQELWNEDLDSSSFQEKQNAIQIGSRGHATLDGDGFVLGIGDPPSEQGMMSSEFRPRKHESDPAIKKGEEIWGRAPAKHPSAEGSPFFSDREKQSEINSKKEQRTLVETKSGQRAVSAKNPQELTFPFEDTEQWDLDKVLQDLEVQSETQRSQTAQKAAFPSGDHETHQAAYQVKLMGKLKELCLKQSRAFFVHRRLRLAKFPHFDEGQGDGRDVPMLAPLTNGQSSTPMKLQYAPEPPTVYIDLRKARLQKCELLAEETESLSESSTDSEEDSRATYQGKAKDGTEEFSQLSRSDCTGKCFLLQQLRTVRRRMSQVPMKGSEMIPQDKRRRQDLKTAEETGLPKVEERRSLKLRGLTSLGSGHPESVAKSFPFLGHVNSKPSSLRDRKKEHGERPHPERTLAPLEDKGTNFSRAKESQKEKQAQEKQRRQRLCDLLERSKPQLSVTGKQPMAKQTPVLFHTESSFLAPVCPLPAAKGSKSKWLCMTIGLSSSGRVSPHHPQSCSFPEISLPAANIYPAVVTWLLFLVSCLRSKGERKAPFRVSGLQQAWHKGCLVLQARLTPVYQSDRQSSAGLQEHNPAEESLQETSLLYQQTSMFLSQTSLWDVIWWKEELARCLQDQPYPFLPEIPDIRLSDIAAVDSDPQVVEEACAVPAGFYWQTVETDEKYFPGSSDIGESDDADTEVAMALLFETLLRNPMAVHHTFQLILASGLDICGLRLLYAPYDILLSSAVTLPPSYTPEKELPVLALSLRGPNARAVLQNIMGPSDPRLASVTDSHSINAAYCTSRAQPLAYLPHTDSRVHRELCVWFGGRACCEERLRSGACPPACKRSKPRPRPSDLQADTGQETSNLEDLGPCTAPATLVATTKGDIILVASPAVPPCTYGRVISTCTQRGFVLQGVKRLRLSPKQAFSLGIPANQVAAFCPGEASGPLDGSCSGDSCPDQSQRHCLALLLRKENAYHHVPSLLKGLMNGLAEEGFLAKRQSSSSPGVGPEPGLSFHAAPYTDSLLQALGGSFCAVPDPCPIPLDILRSRRYASDPDMEQIILLTLSGKEAMKTAGEFLHQILAVGHMKELQAPADSQIRDCAVLDGHGQEFELLALKWLPCLTRTQAKETTPFEVGDKLWHPSINTLVSSPALICALRGIGAFAGLAEILKTQTSPYSKPRANTSDLCRVMSSTPEMAYRQAILFFTRKDFIGDANHRLALRYLPPPVRCPQSKGGEIQTSSAESLFHFMQAGAEVFCTVLLIKPGTWARNLARILRKLDQERFHLVGMRHLNLSPEQADALHSSEDEESLQAHSAHLTSGSSLVLCLQRENAVKKLLNLLGPEDPKQARAANPFFWRAQYGLSSVQNGLYGSVSYCAAVRDIRLFFPEGLCGADSPPLEEEEISTLTSDPVLGLETSPRRRLVKYERRTPVSLRGWEQPQSVERPYLAALCQTTCLILPAALGQGTGRPPYLELLEELIGKDFLVTGAWLTAMNHPQAGFITAILSVTESEASSMRSVLTEGPCLVLAAQRDNAVVCFEALLNGDYCQKRPALDCTQHLLYPKTEKQAEELLCRLFDFLTSASVHQIENLDSF